VVTPPAAVRTRSVPPASGDGAGTAPGFVCTRPRAPTRGGVGTTSPNWTTRTARRPHPRGGRDAPSTDPRTDANRRRGRRIDTRPAPTRGHGRFATWGSRKWTWRTRPLLPAAADVEPLPVVETPNRVKPKFFAGTFLTKPPQTLRFRPSTSGLELLSCGCESIRWPDGEWSLAGSPTRNGH